MVPPSKLFQGHNSGSADGRGEGLALLFLSSILHGCVAKEGGMESPNDLTNKKDIFLPSTLRIKS